ncbi:sensor domain-containing phosphodiesterase [Ferrigenium kumadai]|nr:EAL domain-containing protein [Ferrigenium kumadai]
MKSNDETRRILMHLQHGEAGVTGHHRHFTLRSAFQPIVSLSHCRSVGYEALVRATHCDNSAVSPPALFAGVANESELVHLDRLCRAVHIHNFIRSNDDNSWIFLNVHPSVSVKGRHYGRFFEELLEEVGLPPERVVIEILEDATFDDHQLADAVSFYRDRGCLVAIDDFGIGHSNFGRIWQIKPHIVKLDRSTLVFARQDAAARRVLPGLVNLLHEAGCIVLIEGIEDEYEAMLAMESGADLAQGYYFARPAAQPLTMSESSDTILSLIHGYRSRLQRQDQADRNAAHMPALHRAAIEVAARESLHCPAIDRLLGMNGADRCYLIDHEGRQIGDSRAAAGKAHAGDIRFRPLENASNAIWIRRSYWRRALHKPGEVQVTRPYLSVATGRLCITLSISFNEAGVARVLCLDLEHDEYSP